MLEARQPQHSGTDENERFKALDDYDKGDYFPLRAPRAAMALDQIKSSTPVLWQRAPDPEFPYEARVGNERWVLRLNDFPEEPLYTLLIEGEKVADFNDWPSCWKKSDP